MLDVGNNVKGNLMFLVRVRNSVGIKDQLIGYDVYSTEDFENVMRSYIEKDWVNLTEDTGLGEGDSVLDVVFKGYYVNGLSSDGDYRVSCSLLQDEYDIVVSRKKEVTARVE